MALTKVQISFYKPEGFEDTYVVYTENRGRAVQAVIDSYQGRNMPCVNAIYATLVGEDEAVRLVGRTQARIFGIQATSPDELVGQEAFINRAHEERGRQANRERAKYVQSQGFG